MQLMASAASGVVSGRAIDILTTAPGGATAGGIARVDPGDPVFFDHQLDHVPGMLLTVATLELADYVQLLESDNVNFRITFTKFCELDGPVEVGVLGPLDRTARIDCVQAGAIVATSSLESCDTAQPEEVAPPLLGAGTIASRLVHRTHRGNIAIGPLRFAEGCVWTRVRDQRPISGLRPRTSAVASVIEAARQFTTAVLHRWGEHPVGTKMILVGLTATLPTTATGRAPLALSWRITTAERTRKLCIGVYAVDTCATRVGSILVATRCVDGDEYEQLRAG